MGPRYEGRYPLNLLCGQNIYTLLDGEYILFNGIFGICIINNFSIF